MRFGKRGHWETPTRRNMSFSKIIDRVISEAEVINVVGLGANKLMMVFKRKGQGP